MDPPTCPLNLLLFRLACEWAADESSWETRPSCSRPLFPSLPAFVGLEIWPRKKINPQKKAQDIQCRDRLLNGSTIKKKCFTIMWNDKLRLLSPFPLWWEGKCQWRLPLLWKSRSEAYKHVILWYSERL